MPCLHFSNMRGKLYLAVKCYFLELLELTLLQNLPTDLLWQCHPRTSTLDLKYEDSMTLVPIKQRYDLISCPECQISTCDTLADKIRSNLILTEVHTGPKVRVKI